ncbi:MAG: hypothetical protein AAFZ80_06915 [Cyanobacteria bacterium P01_A01_bin.105]
MASRFTKPSPKQPVQAKSRPTPTPTPQSSPTEWEVLMRPV